MGKIFSVALAALAAICGGWSLGRSNHGLAYREARSDRELIGNLEQPEAKNIGDSWLRVSSIMAKRAWSWAPTSSRTISTILKALASSSCPRLIFRKTARLGPSISCWSQFLANVPCGRACPGQWVSRVVPGARNTGGLRLLSNYRIGYEEERAREEPNVQGVEWFDGNYPTHGQEFVVYNMEEMEVRMEDYVVS
ncbi:Rho GTPase activation protein (RhoGAP) with PHdomain [Striga asiatica]|uniref:Rho GTPase activation protein (RhoGAP) with PHdomain n=1 Tax=Striga asiatica TaxID=4170 RepID=A0A5A7Q6H6_STRAF|nr:Rho GTPase activation protein (RhoGAP) with PHdomain [Striga asiatica]